jgi:chorismate synthase
MSGVFEGKTTGTPISLILFNTDQRSKDYSNIMNVYRPGHADLGYDSKYGFRDYRGGGRSSARETAARVAAGAVAKKLLAELGVTVDAYSVEIGGVEITEDGFDMKERFNNPFTMPDKWAAQKASSVLEQAMASKDSVGGVIQCEVNGLPIGIGEPVFDKLDALLARAILSIGATKGIEFGAGFDAAELLGSENNDNFYADGDKILKYTNNSGGVLGGMSDGDVLWFRTAFKPTPSISQAQKTVTRTKENTEIEITGRHDPIVVPRAVVVVEAMTALVIADMMLANMSARIDGIKKFYNK